jgi:hypothetical protein
MVKVISDILKILHLISRQVVVKTILATRPTLHNPADTGLLSGMSEKKLSPVQPSGE